MHPVVSDLSKAIHRQKRLDTDYSIASFILSCVLFASLHYCFIHLFFYDPTRLFLMIALVQHFVCLLLFFLFAIILVELLNCFHFCCIPLKSSLLVSVYLSPIVSTNILTLLVWNENFRIFTSISYKYFPHFRKNTAYNLIETMSIATVYVSFLHTIHAVLCCTSICCSIIPRVYFRHLNKTKI